MLNYHIHINRSISSLFFCFCYNEYNSFHEQTAYIVFHYTRNTLPELYINIFPVFCSSLLSPTSLYVILQWFQTLYDHNIYICTTDNNIISLQVHPFHMFRSPHDFYCKYYILFFLQHFPYLKTPLPGFMANIFLHAGHLSIDNANHTPPPPIAKHIIPAIIHPNAPFTPNLCDKTKFAKIQVTASIKNAPIRPIKPKKLKPTPVKIFS